jgi:hypothetical protein
MVFYLHGQYLDYKYPTCQRVCGAMNKSVEYCFHDDCRLHDWFEDCVCNFTLEEHLAYLGIHNITFAPLQCNGTWVLVNTTIYQFSINNISQVLDSFNYTDTVCVPFNTSVILPSNAQPVIQDNSIYTTNYIYSQPNNPHFLPRQREDGYWDMAVIYDNLTTIIYWHNGSVEYHGYSLPPMNDSEARIWLEEALNCTSDNIEPSSASQFILASPQHSDGWTEDNCTYDSATNTHSCPPIHLIVHNA